MMRSSFFYDASSAGQQQSSSQWIPYPSFYNGYSNQPPITTHTQAVPVVVQRYIPTEIHSQPYPIQTYSNFTPSSPMKFPSSRLRQAFSWSQHHPQASNSSDDEFLYHEQQLNQNLTKHGFKRLPVKGDGNCLFYALAEGLIYEMNQDPVEFGSFLRQILHLSRQFRLAEMADRLRQFCVDQWRTNESYYSQFVDQEKVTFLKEVKKFSKNGVSESTLGDIVPLTIANAFDINITIFTSVPDLPRIDVKSEAKVSSTIPQKQIYLAYNQFGLGHYDAAYASYC